MSRANVAQYNGTRTDSYIRDPPVPVVARVGRIPWAPYGILLLLPSWLYFAQLRFFLIGVHDGQTFADKEAISWDRAYFLSLDKANPLYF